MVTPLLWIAAYLATGLGLSVGIVIFDVVSEWRKGIDITLGHLGMLAGFVAAMLFVWPLWMILEGVEWLRKNWSLDRDTVILRGSSSAKVYRALRNDP